jgi:TetR/AcrR family transcriptional regulator
MPASSPALGRRERNKQQKLERIIEAAGELFARRGVDDVTTQEVAEKADIGTGTLFLYARTKGELLLLVQNASYEHALEVGAAAVEGVTDPVEAVMAIARPVVECNRVQIDNGRAYLREIIFGDPEEPHHAAALDLTARTAEGMAQSLVRVAGLTPVDAATRARIVSSVMFTTMAVTANATASIEEILDQIRGQVAIILAA